MAMTRHPYSHASARLALPGALVLALAATAPAIAIDLSGTLRVWGGPLEIDDEKSDQLDQRYTLNLSQAISPYLRLQLSYRYTDFENRPDAGATIGRSTREPLVELLYNRQTFAARFSFRDREVRDQGAGEDLDIRSYVGSLEWRPRRGPRFTLRYQDETNAAADTTIFGRDTESRLLDFAAIYNRRSWNARYLYRASELENNINRFRLDQESHALRAFFSDRFWDGKVGLSFDGQITQVRQEESVAAGTRFARPLSASAGLFAIDTSPEDGDLTGSPDLVDGDFETPVTPRIELGGGSTFRNIGVDLGVTRPVSRLEITVDALSDALLWMVYRSSDNLNWRRVDGVTADFDVAQLRFTIRFPEATDRFFKAVNVSANSFTEVAVTEIRALVETDEIGRQETDATTYWATAIASFDPTRRVGVTLTASIRNDEDVAGGRLSRALDDSSYDARMRVLLTDELVLRVGYRFTTLEERLEPRLERDEEQLLAALEWSPLPTVDVVLDALSREETEDGSLLRTIDTLRLRARTELLPDLSLTSELSHNRIDDPFSGFEQTGWRWLETLEATPTPGWTVAALVSVSRYDSTGIATLSRRDSYQLRTSWQATPYLRLSGDWTQTDNDGRATLDQRYGVIWSPGRKLNVSVVHQDTETDQVRRTSSSTAGVNFRLNRRLTFWVNLSRSEFEEAGSLDSKILNLRTGLNVTF